MFFKIISYIPLVIIGLILFLFTYFFWLHPYTDVVKMILHFYESTDKTEKFKEQFLDLIIL